jgi:hypothetical protein
MMRLTVLIVAVAVAVANTMLWWNGFFYVVAIAAVAVIVWPELPGNILRWLNQ